MPKNPPSSNVVQSSEDPFLGPPALTGAIGADVVEVDSGLIGADVIVFVVSADLIRT